MTETSLNDLASLTNEYATVQGHGHGQAESHVADTTHAEAHEAQSASGEFSFSDLIAKNTGDHNEWSWFDAVHVDLPKIIIDDGVHVYKNSESMEAAGLYTTAHHKIVNAQTHEAPMLDLSITSLVVFQWLAMIILALAFWKAKAHYKKHPLRAPKGFAGMIDSLIVFIREDVALPNVGPRLTKKMLPYFFGLFSFILILNLFGLVPGGHVATSNISVTGVLALITFFVVQSVSVSQIGLKGWFKNLLGGAPIALAPIMVPIEIISMFVKPFALAIRLFANMTAGHIVILCLIGLMFVFKMLLVSPLIIGFTVFIFALEMLVSFIQAYIFTMLTAVFVGLASHDH